MYKRGFTLIELLVVIAIIALLSSIIVAALGPAKQSGRDAKRIADVKNIQIALALYYNDYLKYPPTLTTLIPIYLSNLPKDPDSNHSYMYAALTTTNPPSCNQAYRYHLGAILEQSSNLALGEDADLIYNANGYQACSGSNSDIHGQSPDCGVSGGSPELCYDVTGN